MILPSSLLAELADICKLLVSDAVIVAPPLRGRRTLSSVKMKSLMSFV